MHHSTTPGTPAHEAIHGGRGGVAEDRSAGGWARAPNPGVRALAPPAAAGPPLGI